ncbi:MAG: hypothetical protein MZV63_71260 [Marinilabiliales bacterium]|nr:hypothetical protein [Marinilabiliales bacterium]
MKTVTPTRANIQLVLVSEGALFKGGEMVFQDNEVDAYGHAKLGGIGDLVSAEIKEHTAKFNNGKVNQYH